MNLERKFSKIHEVFGNKKKWSAKVQDDTILHIACKERMSTEIIDYLTKIINVDFENCSYETALFYTCKSIKDTEIIKCLLRNKANPNIGNTYYLEKNLHATITQCDKRNLEIIKILLEYKADPLLVDKKGLTLIHLLGYDEDVDILRYLVLEKNMSVDIKCTFEATPAHCYAKSHNFKLLKEIVNLKADIHSLDNKNNSILHYLLMKDLRNLPTICHSALFDVVSFLVEKKIDLNSKNEFQDTFLHCLLSFKEFEFSLIQLLIQNKADLNAINSNLETPIFSYFNNGYLSNYDLIHYFVKNKADLNLVNKYQKTLLFICTDKRIEEENYFDTIKILVENKADLNFVSQNDLKTPLHNVVSKDNLHSETVKFLVSQKADLNVKNRNQNTCFSYLFLKKEIDHSLVKFMIENKAFLDIEHSSFLFNVICKDNNLDLVALNILLVMKADINYKEKKTGFTPLHSVCSKNNCSGLILFLLNNKSDPNIFNNEKSTPLHVISGSYASTIEAVKLLLQFKADPFCLNSNNLSPINIASKNSTLCNQISSHNITVEELYTSEYKKDSCILF